MTDFAHINQLTSDRQAAAARLLEDGASFKEIERTLHMHARTLRKYFPGRGWTQKQGGAFRAATRYLSKEF